MTLSSRVLASLSWHSNIYYQARCSCRILVTVRSLQKDICKSTTAPAPFCSARSTESVFFSPPLSLYASPSHSLHWLSLLLNKSFPALNPVRIEKLLLSWRMFFQPAWQWLWRAQIQSNEPVNSDGGNRALWDLVKEMGYWVFFSLSGWGNKELWSKHSCLPTYGHRGQFLLM